MRILLKKVMLLRPDAVDPDSIGQFNLVQGIGEEPLFLPVAPGPGKLQADEHAELHGGVHRSRVPAR